MSNSVQFGAYTEGYNAGLEAGKLKWISVDERLPDVGTVKNGAKGWLVWDGDREYFTREHPANWNMIGEYDDGTPIESSKVIKWFDSPPAQ